MAMGDMARLKLIYIAGTNYSGTTLLSSILGCHPAAESLGQLYEIHDYHQQERKCMCGEAVPACSFWSQVLPGCAEHWHRGLGRLDPYPSEFSFNGPITGRLRLMWPVRPDNVARYRAFTLALLASAARVSGRQTLVDASKHAHRLTWLCRSGVADALDLRVVQMTRNGQGVMASYMKRGQSAARGALAWRQRNAAVQRAVDRYGAGRTTRLTYEELCGDPEAAIRRVCGAVGLPFDAAMLDFRARTQHQVGGNPMRFSDEREITLREGWRQKLTPAQRATFKLLAGRAQRALGYEV